MPFFKPLGTLDYDIFGTSIKLNNLLTAGNPNGIFKKDVLQNYTINNQTPEQVSQSLYNDPQYWWVICYINGIVNPYTDWFLTQSQLYNMTIEKYGAAHVLDVHHFVNSTSGFIVDDFDTITYKTMVGNNTPLPNNIIQYTNYDYELEQNNKKQIIKVLPQQYITQFNSQYTSSMNYGK